MKQPVAGIDVSKATLDVAFKTEAASGAVAERFSDDNTDAGWTRIAARLAAAKVVPVGLEVTGNDEAGVTAALRKATVPVLVFDPRQIHGFRQFRQKRAKTDPIDAALIADVTAAADPHVAPDPRLASLAEHLTLIDMIIEDIARLQTRRDRFTDPDNRAILEDQIRDLDRRRPAEIVRLRAKVRAEADLDQRLTLLLSIPGIGIGTALAFVIRIPPLATPPSFAWRDPWPAPPELGRMTREQAAARVSVAPFNADSGQTQAGRHIAGGRKRLRRLVFLAAFSGAQRWNPILVALYKRLKAAGKHHTLATLACARKLVEIANAVFARNTPWADTKPGKPVQP